VGIGSRCRRSSSNEAFGANDLVIGQSNTASENEATITGGVHNGMGHYPPQHKTHAGQSNRLRNLRRFCAWHVEHDHKYEHFGGSFGRLNCDLEVV
jgi:hypothetical protein